MIGSSELIFCIYLQFKSQVSALNVHGIPAETDFKQTSEYLIAIIVISH